MNSSIYVGQVNHHRYTPREHAFNYGLFMMSIDLAELPHLFDDYLLWSARRFNLGWFRRDDYMGDSNVPLELAVRDEVERITGQRPAGPIKLLTHLRYAGIGFNPISFYFCYADAEANVPETIISEVSNTPWNERHMYIMPVPESGETQFDYECDKHFHVSPFMPLDIQYRWRFRFCEKRIDVKIENWRDSEKLFAATLNLHREDLNASNLRRCLLKFPLITLKVVTAIYYEAARLWLKKIPFHPHPERLEVSQQVNKK